MLAELFFLAAIWLLLSFALVLLLGTRVRRGGPFSSGLYLGLLTGIGAFFGLALLGIPWDTVGIASAAVLVLGIVLIFKLPHWNAPGQVFFLFSIVTVAVYLAYAFAITAFSPTSPVAFLFSFLLFLLETAALSLSLSYAFEVLDVLCRVRWQRRAMPPPSDGFAPMVSLHVPAYNEPPELVEKTLRALAALDYPNYEVLLVDNNTPEESAWQPLARVCSELGFKCLHLDKWPGYKSGALNFALTMTDPRAEIIGVIDADYLVQPDYLRRIVPYFQDPSIAFVQTPQDYRDYQINRFFQAAYDGYKYFFALSMPARNERNAIIFCGTMGLLRKDVLQEIGGWDEWCITEDAEASLRILNKGYQSLFVPETFGRGLMPLDFEGMKKQRFRWAFGGVQILKKHWSKMMPWARWLDPANRLTGAQRYFYLMSGLQWFNELITFAFTIMAVASAVLTITGHTEFLRPTTTAFVILPITLIGTNMLRALWGLRHALGISWTRAWLALSLWFSLTWVVALACVEAVVRKRGVFLRTPKTQGKAAWARALRITGLETTLGVACVLGALGVLATSISPFTIGLAVLCLTQALIYLSAPLQSMFSLARRIPRVEADRAEIRGAVASESQLGLRAAIAALAVLVLVFLAALLPQPTEEPKYYTSFNPEPLITPRVEPNPILSGAGGGLLAPLPILPTPVTFTPTPIITPSPTLATPTPLSTLTAVFTATPTPPTTTPTALPTATATAALTPTLLPTSTPTSLPTVVPTSTPNTLPTDTPTPVPTLAATATTPPPSPTGAPATDTPVPNPTPTP